MMGLDARIGFCFAVAVLFTVCRFQPRKTVSKRVGETEHGFTEIEQRKSKYQMNLNMYWKQTHARACCVSAVEMQN